MSGSSSLESNTSPLLAAAGGLVGKLLKDVSPVEFWRRVFLASIVPFCGSIFWYYARTVIQVTDEEQSLWIQMWLMGQQQRSALALRVRRLMLLSPAAKTGRQGRVPWDDRPARHEEDEKEDGEEGRFAPPKFEFQPASGVSAWTWYGWWPVSLVNNHFGADVGDDYYYGRPGGVKRGSGYSVTVWLAPSGTRVVRDILLQGRQLLLAKRAKKTEIWLCGDRRFSSNNFKVVTRPSRPLSSVIVEGHTKETLRQDAVRFLGSEKWYVGKGIPYRRGFLLHGPPGCGKTSLVTALAGELRLPIVVIPLNSKDMDDQMLMKVMGDAPKDSIVLVEDIDCALPRGADQQGVAVARMTGRMPVTFSGLLNAIDGVGAQEGRLLFMTTNHLDRLDEALIRPGRVDVKFYLGKASRAAAGELFDQFFSSSSADPAMMIEEFSPEIIPQARSAFLANVKDGVHSFAALQGVLMTARDDPRLAEEGMRNLVASIEASVNGDKPPTSWETLASIESLSRGALEKEKKDEEEQLSSGSVIVKRLSGSALETKHDIKKRILAISSFSTFGAPGKFVSSGVLYYEIEIIKAHGGCPQFGFALENGIKETEELTDIGVGDNDKSWAVDGYRGQKWHGEPENWSCYWKDGAVIGLAANVDTGMIAVSVDGSWGNGKDELGMVFQSDLIKEGVFPCFTASAFKLRYAFEKVDLKHGPPPESIWKVPGGEVKQPSVQS